MHTKFLSFRPAGSVILLLFVLFSCKKDQRILDTSVQPEGDKFSASVVEEYKVDAYTFPHEDIISYNSKDKFLGSNIDPVFGRTDIGLYLSVNNGNEAGNFSNAVFIKAEFRLVTENAGFLGSAIAPCTYSVFAVTTTLNKNQPYYVSNDQNHSPNPLPGTTTGYPVPGTPNRMVIGLDPSYAEQMLHDVPAWVSNATFQAKYKGFYLLGSPAGGNGQIMKCNLDDPASGLFIFYKSDTSATKVDSLRLAFAGDPGVRYNTVKHDYSQAAAELQGQLGGDTTVTNYLYLQGMGGTKARINIPVLPYVSDSFQLAISRAELVLPYDELFSSKDYKMPPHLSLLAVSSAGKDSIVYDQVNTTDNVRYDGKVDTIRKIFVFNIARHMQAIVKGRVVNRGFNLVVSDPLRSGTFFRDENIERVVLGGPKNAALKPTFKLTYSKVSIR